MQTNFAGPHLRRDQSRDNWGLQKNQLQHRFFADAFKASSRLPLTSSASQPLEQFAKTSSQDQRSIGLDSSIENSPFAQGFKKTQSSQLPTQICLSQIGSSSPTPQTSQLSEVQSSYQSGPNMVQPLEGIFSAEQHSQAVGAPSITISVSGYKIPKRWSNQTEYQRIQERKFRRLACMMALEETANADMPRVETRLDKALSTLGNSKNIKSQQLASYAEIMMLHETEVILHLAQDFKLMDDSTNMIFYIIFQGRKGKLLLDIPQNLKDRSWMMQARKKYADKPARAVHSAYHLQTLAAIKWAAALEEYKAMSTEQYFTKLRYHSEYLAEVNPGLSSLGLATSGKVREPRVLIYLNLMVDLLGLGSTHKRLVKYVSQLLIRSLFWFYKHPPTQVAFGILSFVLGYSNDPLVELFREVRRNPAASKQEDTRMRHKEAVAELQHFGVRVQNKLEHIRTLCRMEGDSLREVDLLLDEIFAAK